MKQPIGFEMKDQEILVSRLLESLYELKQASK